MGKNKKPKHQNFQAPSKSPKTSAQVEPSGKTPKEKPQDPPNEFPPSWQVVLLEMVDPFGWHEIPKEDLERIRRKLIEFERLTWGDILIRDKYANHSVSIEDICKEAQDRLIELKQDEIEELISLRITGKERIWGIRDGTTLKLLWWDPEHEICPSAKKHT